MFYPFLEVKIDILNIFGGIFVIQLTSDGGSLQWCIYSTFTFICVYNLVTFCSNKMDGLVVNKTGLMSWRQFCGFQRVCGAGFTKELKLLEILLLLLIDIY